MKVRKGGINGDTRYKGADQFYEIRVFYSIDSRVTSAYGEKRCRLNKLPENPLPKDVWGNGTSEKCRPPRSIQIGRMDGDWGSVTS